MEAPRDRKKKRTSARIRARKRRRRTAIVVSVVILILIASTAYYISSSNVLSNARIMNNTPEITLYGEAEIIMSNPQAKHNYFAWPSICRLQNNKLAVVASGYRIAHVDPFGQTVISYSEDEGETWTAPAAVIDTVLDDRDGGILPYGKQNVIVTSFNNTIESQRARSSAVYQNSYLDTITPEEEAAALGSLYRISTDGGVTFGDIRKSPITSPHGPCQLSNGSLLWVGTLYDINGGEPTTQVYRMNHVGDMEKIGEIEDIPGYNSAEPYAIEVDDGRIICHIRVQAEKNHYANKFTIYQSESSDGGKTWTTPHQILEDTGGAPSHILRHSSGVLISTYGVRTDFYGVKAMFSYDNGKTWMTDYILYDNSVYENISTSRDIGYPATVELEDGSLLTVFYAHPSEDAPAVIMQQKWSFF